MSQQFECPWCKNKIQKATGSSVQSFLLSFEVGTYSDIFGSSLEGYEIADMCTSCAWKLREKLVEMGIEIKGFEI